MIMESCKFGPAKSAHLRRQQWQNTRKTHLVGMRKYEEVTSQEIREKRIPAFEISTNVIKIEQTHSFTTYTYIDTFIWCCILRFAISSIRGVRHVVKKLVGNQTCTMLTLSWQSALILLISIHLIVHRASQISCCDVLCFLFTVPGNILVSSYSSPKDSCTF